MTIEEWAKDFKSYVNELQIPRDDYKGIMEYIDDALDLLKEQDDMGKELTDAMELVRKKNERIEKLLKEQEAVVRCKDCKYSLSNSRFCAYPHKKNNIQQGDWFCADGERKEGR